MGFVDNYQTYLNLNEKLRYIKLKLEQIFFQAGRNF